MVAKPLHVEAIVVVERSDLGKLFPALANRGYQVVGPTVRDGAIAYARLTSASDLPVGWTDVQGGGKYQLKRRNDDAYFGFAVGPQPWKQFLHPPHQQLFQAERKAKSFRVLPTLTDAPKYAFIGVRACELHATSIQDKVLKEGQFIDPGYRRRRENLFIVAVNCSQAGGTCFCVSMQTGPKATTGFDLALSEVIQKERHYFVVEVGTAQGASVLSDIPHRVAEENEKQIAARIVAETSSHMGRTMDTDGIKELLYRNLEHPRWDQVAARCLTCANCTMVCPTCFCTTIEDVTNLTGDHAERWKRWDSCFTSDFSYIHGGSVRATSRSRYRQWMMHKLATWIDQFGTSGCVGCGRCITWCPVGIDLTEEVAAIRESETVRSGKDRHVTHP